MKKRIILILFPLVFVFIGYAQTNDSTKTPLHFGVVGTVTNKGISVIPTFTLGKPAAIFDVIVGKRLTFEPQLRYSLEAKPWSFIFWLRYKLIRNERFTLNVGAHPSVVFSTVPAMINGVTKDVITSTRYFATEIVPNFKVNNHFSIGLYYLTSWGFAEASIKHTDFLTLNTNINNIKLGKELALRINPQFYFLKMDARSGTYVTSTFTLSKNRSPISVQYMFNQPINTNIIGGQDFVWNVSLIYAFHKNYYSSK